MKHNDFLKTTTPEQRARILWQQKMLARQGYYPWGRAPLGFNKTRTQGMRTGLPTLITNADGVAIAEVFVMITTGEIKSYIEAASYLMVARGMNLTRTKLNAILKNPNYKGYLDTDIGWVIGKYTPPVTPEVFDKVQGIISTWKSKR